MNELTFMKKFLSLTLILLGFTFSLAQDLYLVKLKPKENTSNFLSNPLQILSQRSLDRREKYKISITEEDVLFLSIELMNLKNYH